MLSFSSISFSFAANPYSWLFSFTIYSFAILLCVVFSLLWLSPICFDSFAFWSYFLFKKSKLKCFSYYTSLCALYILLTEILIISKRLNDCFSRFLYCCSELFIKCLVLTNSNFDSYCFWWIDTYLGYKSLLCILKFKV